MPRPKRSEDSKLPGHVRAMKYIFADADAPVHHYGSPIVSDFASPRILEERKHD